MKFSIITVCYNSEKTIRRTMESVLNQTYKDYEYIIIDGKSTDKTIDIVKEYEGLFCGRMRFISEPDTGIYNAMNKGIRLCSGSIIGIVNSDDWLQPDALEIVKTYAEKITYSHFIISGWMYFHYDDGAVQILKNTYERYERKMRIYAMGLRHPATFVSKSVYEQFGVFDENLKVSADREFVIRCYFQENVHVYIIPQILTNMSDGGASEQRPTYKHLQTRIQDSKYILQKYIKNKLKFTCVFGFYRLLLYSKYLMPLSVKKLLR